MINPQRCAQRIVLNDPDLAVPLFDLLLKAVEPGFKDSNDYDEIMGDLYKRIQHSRDAREAYAKGRLQHADLQAVDRVEHATAGNN